MIEIIILVIPVALVFYFIGRWLKDSVKKDDEKRKEEELKTQVQSVSNNRPVKEYPILNVVLTVIAVIIGLYFLTSVITDIGAGRDNPCAGAAEEECRAIEALEGSR